jgi:hypothetical protein
MNRASKRQNKKSAASVQALVGIKAFTDYGLLTNSGELLLYLVLPTNLSVLSSSSIESKIRQLTLALSAVPELEIACTDSAECFDDNKAYLSERMNAEANGKVGVQKEGYVYMSYEVSSSAMYQPEVRITLQIAQEETIHIPTFEDTEPSGVNVGALVGGIVGGVAGLGLIVGATILIVKKKRK